jgi:hypothetical protein
VEIAKWYRHAGLVLIALIYLWAYLTATDPFWAGRATFFGMAVLLAVALMDLVVKDGVD